jgi:ribonuclease P protein subunit POP4
MDKAVLLSGELVGLNAKVAGTEIEGKIVDETRNTLVIKHNAKKKRVIKNSNDFEIILKNQKIRVDGKDLVGRPEERIKKTW